MKVENNIKDIYKLTPMQEGMLFHALQQKTASLYTIQSVYKIQGRLNVNNIEKAIDYIVDRHDVLRTAFVHKKVKEPLQLVLAKRKIDFSYVDLTKESLKQEKSDSLKRDTRETPFRLDKDPLVRLQLIQFDDDNYELVWSYYHIIMDGWCLNIIISEFWQVYNAINENQKIELPPVVQFSSYIKWLQRKDIANGSKFWKEYLKGYGECVSLKDHSSKEPPGNITDEYECAIAGTLVEKIRYQSAQLGISLNNYLQSAWAILLGKISNSNDVVFGSVVSGRPYNIPGVEKIIGLFINTVPVRFKLTEDYTAGEILKTAQRKYYDCEQFHYYPLYKIQAENSPNNKLFDHIFIFENYPGNSGKSNNQNIQISREKGTEQSNYIFNVVVSVAADTILFNFIFDKTRYSEAFITKLFEVLEHILTQIIENVEIRYIDIQLVDKIGKKTAIDITYQNDDLGNVLELFLENVAKKPDYKIITYTEDLSGIYERYNITPSKEGKVWISNELSYQQLFDKARYLGGILYNSGVRKGEIVALYLEPSEYIPVAILACIMNGAAFLPIDPALPVKRIEYMLKDSSCRYLISDISKCDFSFNGHIIDAIERSEENDIHWDFPQISGNDPLYIIYTSGTTGKPKGVVVRNSSIVNYVNWFTGFISLSSNDSTMMLSSYAYDLIYTSLFTSLLKVCRLHIVSKSFILSSTNVLNYICQNNITFIKITPSYFSILAHSTHYNYNTVSSLRFIVLGGEKLKNEDINVAKAKCKETQFINHYGPTEATIGCIANKIEFNAESKAIDVEIIGISITNSEAFILNNSLTTNPNYFFGQLCITGEGLALGYLNQAEITDSRFITNELLKERSYLTGDLAVKVANDQIMYLYRKDNQIKFNGYRVELEEIEKTLKSNPNIEDAVIILENTNFSQRLKGFFTLKLRQETHEKHIQSAEDSPTFNNYAAKIDSIKRFQESIAIQTEKNKFSNSFVNSISDILASHLIKISKPQSLTEREKDRYKRQMLLTGWDEHAQLILKNSKVFVAGAGGGASPTLVQLAMAGIGTIVICDFDTVELSNLNRQFVHQEDRIGMDKTESAGKTLAQINSDINIITIKEKLEEENIDRLIGDAEIIFDMFDNPAEKFLISEYAHKKGIPHVIAGMIDINGYACIFHSDHTACYNCVFDKAKYARLLKGLNSVISNYSKKSLAVSSSSLFMGSGFVVNEAIKYLLGFKDIAWNKFIYFNSRGEESLSESFGFKSMTYLFNDNFKESSLRQGFDWNIGTRGKMLEEITFDKDPHCPVCAIRSEETDRHIKSESISLNTQNKKVVTSDNYIAILIEPNDVNFFISTLSVIKASKNLLLLNPESTEVSINRIIYNENISVIITDSKWYSKLNSFDIIRKREIIVVDIGKYQQSNVRYKASNLDYSSDIRILDYSYSIENNTAPKVLSVNEEMGRWQTNSPGIPDKVLKNSVATANLIGFLSKNGVYELSNINKESLTEELKEFMAGYLPNYMIPQQLIQLDSMPLTLNGKIDKNALAKYSFAETETGQISELTSTERKLAEIWSEILDIDVSLFHKESDFFKMGGHSINAITFENKAERIFNVNISISDIFEHTTITSMGLLIDKKDNKTFKPVKRVEKKEYYLASAAQKRMFMMDKLKDGKNEGDTTPAVFIIRGKLDVKKLEFVFNQLVQLHESLRTLMLLIRT